MHEVVLTRGNFAQQGVLREGLDGEADLLVGPLADEDGDGAVPQGVHVRFQIVESHHAALRDSGLPVDESLVHYDTIVRETGFEAGLKAIDAGCDALYSAGDFSALGAIEAARERGLRIPEEFGIVGTANEAFTALMTPSMSSLALNPFEMGRQAAQAFLSGEEGTVVVPMELKVRESSCRNKLQNLSI